MQSSLDIRHQRILGINFFNGNVYQLLRALKPGILLVAPAAPALAKLKTDVEYQNAIHSADIAIADSGLMAFIWNLLHPFDKICRISGFYFLWTLILSKELQPEKSSFWIMPSIKDKKAAENWLNSEQNFQLTNDDFYIAPQYQKNPVEDFKLVQLLNIKRPKFVIINLGGGTQEKLGAFLKKELAYKSTIICTGAAIAFMSGRQAKIPSWADAFYLGWFLRCLQNPITFVPRYIKALSFIPLLLKFKDKTPSS